MKTKSACIFLLRELENDASTGSKERLLLSQSRAGYFDLFVQAGATFERVGFGRLNTAGSIGVPSRPGGISTGAFRLSGGG